MFSLIQTSALIVLIATTICYILQISKSNNAIADIFWGIGFCLLAIYSYAHFAIGNPRQILITVLTSIWGIRLAVFLLIRQKDKAEDFRYANWRKSWGKTFYWRTFLQVNLLQGFFMLLISLPILLVNFSSNNAINLADAFAVSLWLIGFYFESVSDYQKLKFKQKEENKGKFINSGLWSISRHPNYFGEMLIWWSIFILASNAGYFWQALISPVLISFLLLKVSGIPMLEHKYKGDAAFEKYKQNTPALFPKLF